ncbi:MAG: peptidase and chymotrypsin/Hap [Hyphomicrobiales bacterium]|nr:peptidase and chymotrypsin/Hap [Hyphomicrobiales bacterium]
MARVNRLLPAAALAVSCAVSFNANALVGASEEASAREGAHAIMVLKRGGRSAGFCTGVVLSPTVVLTAGHCAHGADALAVNVTRQGAPRIVSVVDASIHPEFRPDAIKKRERSIDLALLRLAEPLPSAFQPAALSPTNALAVGDRYRIAGFGITREGDGDSAGRLRAGELEARAPASRILLWAKDPNAKGFGACTGDSGGPVFAADGSVFAIVTWSTGEGRKQCGTITQGALVAPQRAWIDGLLARWR